jgi:prephenate dehydratase
MADPFNLRLRTEWVEIISPIEIRIRHFLSGKNNNTLHKIDTSQTVYLFFFFVQLNNYISNLSLLKISYKKSTGSVR